MFLNDRQLMSNHRRTTILKWLYIQKNLSHIKQISIQEIPLCVDFHGNFIIVNNYLNYFLGSFEPKLFVGHTDLPSACPIKIIENFLCICHTNIDVHKNSINQLNLLIEQNEIDAMLFSVTGPWSTSQDNSLICYVYGKSVYIAELQYPYRIQFAYKTKDKIYSVCVSNDMRVGIGLGNKILILGI